MTNTATKADLARYESSLQPWKYIHSVKLGTRKGLEKQRGFIERLLMRTNIALKNAIDSLKGRA